MYHMFCLIKYGCIILTLLLQYLIKCLLMNILYDSRKLHTTKRNLYVIEKIMLQVQETLENMNLMNIYKILT